MEAWIRQNKNIFIISKNTFAKDGQQNLRNFWKVERNPLWVGGVWRIPGSALLDCNHHQRASLWSAWRCGRVFRAGNSTFLMFSNLKNKMPNIRFFAPFFSLQHIPARTDYSIVHCASRLSLLKEGRAAVWGMRGLSLLQGIFYWLFFLCVWET